MSSVPHNTYPYDFIIYSVVYLYIMTRLSEYELWTLNIHKVIAFNIDGAKWRKRDLKAQVNRKK